MVSQTIVRRPLQGLVEIVGKGEHVRRAQQEIRGEIEASLDRTARLIAGRLRTGSKPRRRPR